MVVCGTCAQVNIWGKGDEQSMKTGIHTVSLSPVQPPRRRDTTSLPRSVWFVILNIDPLCRKERFQVSLQHKKFRYLLQTKNQSFMKIYFDAYLYRICNWVGLTEQWVSYTIECISYTQRNLFRILLNQQKVWLYSSSSAWFGTERNSVWC